jgi:hypothetical protein
LELIVPIGNLVGLQRHALARRRVDLDQPNLVGDVVHADGAWPDEFMDRRVVREQSVPVGVPADHHRRKYCRHAAGGEQMLQADRFAGRRKFRQSAGGDIGRAYN